MQTILGGGGAIGTLLAASLDQYTEEIKIVSRTPEKVNDRDTLFSADLTHPEEVYKSIKGSRIVYLTIGFDNYSAKAWQEKWPPLMRNLIDACKKYGSKLVFFDNVYMYDPKYIGNMTEDTPVNPDSKKGKVRAEIAEMITDEFQSDQLDALIARSADFYGPDSSNSILGETVINNFKKGKAANWLADADKIHNFTFTPDAAAATALLGNTSEAYNQVWHLPTDHTKLTGKEWIDLIAKEMNVSPKYRTLPIWMMGILGLFIPVMRELKEMAYQYDRDYFFNSNKFEDSFHITPTAPAESLRQLLNK